MKKLFFALSMLTFALAALPQARGDDISIDFIYDNLSGGNWIDVEGYGYGWQPDVATSDPNWRPYSDGYWAYTDYGWTWISYEDFGWATYHYGRWANLGDYGWVWFPGSDLDWGPAWVSWRTGGDYIGWAPLPPRGPGVVYESQPIGVNVDVVFDIGPEYYNFCDVRFIGEPVLRDRIIPPVQNVTYITNTVNVTNIYVQNNVVYNYGPDYNVVNTYSSRPIQRLTIERQAPANLTTAIKSGTLTKVQGNKLLVAAPQKLTQAAPNAKPPAVKAKVAQPKIERGWKGVPNKAELEQKIKTENPKNVPPPTRAAAREGGSPASAIGKLSPGAGGPATSPGPRGKQERGRGRAASGNVGAAPNEPAQAGKEKEAGMKDLEAEREKSPLERGKGRRGARARPGATAMPGEDAGRISPPPAEENEPGGRARPGAVPPGQQENLSPSQSERGKRRGKPGERSPEPGAGATGASPSDGAPAKPEHAQPPARRLGEKSSPSQGGTGQVPPQDRDQAPQRQRFGTPAPMGAADHQQRGGGPPSGVRQPVNPPDRGASMSEARGEGQRGQGSHGQPSQQQRGGATSGAEHRQGEGQSEGGKKKGPKETPPPRPQ